MKNIVSFAFLSLSLCAQLNASSLMDTTIIEILDDTLETLYFHQEAYEKPTRLVYPNLTRLNSYAYFHQNENLISIDFPQLKYLGDYLYVYGNESLNYLKGPAIDTIHNSLSISGNTSLTELSICGLTHILSTDEHDIPSYNIDNNTPAIDGQNACFSKGPPENLQLTNLTIQENKPENSHVAILSAEGNYVTNDFTYFLTEDNFNNEFFTIDEDTLRTNTVFDYEENVTYEISIGVYNQLGEMLVENFVITIEDVENEGIQIIEILDDTLASIYYHQESFPMPTRLVFPNLTTVEGFIYFHQNVNLISIDFPILHFVGDYVYFNENTVLESLKSPVIDTIHNSLYVSGNTAMTEFDFCTLSHIISTEADQTPSYYIENNTVDIDVKPTCFSQGPPENLTLSGTNILENSSVNTIIGTLDAEGNYPINTFTFYLTEDHPDNEFFVIDSDTLKSDAAFDFEINNQFEISIGVYNQLGESVSETYLITVEDIETEGEQVLEILADTLDNLYYHQENFTQPTRLVFPNLTTVLGFTYFHQNVNLVSVDLPLLQYVGDYTYFHENAVLEYVKCPSIDTIHNYLYAYGNQSLTELDVCSLAHIISTEEETEAYYYIDNNPVLILETTCLDSSILSFSPLDSLVQSNYIKLGEFEAEASNEFIHFINDGGEEVSETKEFIIIENGLYLTKDYAYYIEDIYPLSIASIKLDNNPNTSLNEKILSSISVEVKDKNVLSQVDQASGFSQFRCYPNPAREQISISHTKSQNYQTRIIDLKGKTVHESLNQSIIDIKHLGAGVYLIEYTELNTGKIETQKLVIGQ